jgi:hypothetical protein
MRAMLALTFTVGFLLSWMPASAGETPDTLMASPGTPTLSDDVVPAADGGEDDGDHVLAAATSWTSTPRRVRDSPNDIDRTRIRFERPPRLRSARS